MLNLRKEIGLTFDDVLLVPQRTPLQSRSEVDLSTHLTPKIRIKAPIVSSNMDTVTEADMAIAMAQEGGMGFIHRFLTIEREAEEVKKVKKMGLKVGAAIGINNDYRERCEALVKAKTDIIVLDIAHGHSVYLIKVLKELKKKYKKTEFLAGNVATARAVKELVENGADAIKVGIGPGALCTTRIVSGAGVPQLTAIDECAEEAKKHGIPINADGGIRSSGDIVKALAAGASSVMIGSLFAGCKESPALVFFRNNQKFKLTRGMASLMASYDRQRHNNVNKDLKNYAAEGVEAVVPYRSSVGDLIKQFLSGIRSGLSYNGAKNIKELQEKAEFIQITQSSLIESRAHDVTVM